MYDKFEIQGVHADLDTKVKTYARKKIGHLDKYLSKHARQSAHVEVMLKEGKAKNKNRFTCEVKMVLPKQTLIVKESAVNFFSAIDIAETKLKQMLQKYKQTHSDGKLHRRLFARISRAKAI